MPESKREVWPSLKPRKPSEAARREAQAPLPPSIGEVVRRTIKQARDGEGRANKKGGAEKGVHFPPTTPEGVGPTVEKYLEI